MSRFAVPVRAVLFAAAVLIVGGAVLAFALTGRHDSPAQPSTGGQGGPVVVVAPPTVAGTPAAPVPRSISRSAVPATDGPGEEPSEPPTPAADAAAVEAGTAFAAAWLNSGDREWPTKLAAMSTPDLASVWGQADPATVPVGRVGGPVRIRAAGDGLADVDVPVVDSKGGPVGLLTVEVVTSGGRWLVSDVDWSPAR